MVSIAFMACSVIVAMVLVLCIWSLLMFKYASGEAHKRHSGPLQDSPFRKKGNK